MRLLIVLAVLALCGCSAIESDSAAKCDFTCDECKNVKLECTTADNDSQYNVVIPAGN